MPEWNKAMSYSTEAQVRGWGMLFTKNTTVLKHLLRPCSVTAKIAEMLLYDGHPAEHQEKSNAHSLFRIPWDRTAANTPRIPPLEAAATSVLSGTAKFPPQGSSHRAQSSWGKPRALNQPPEENVKHTNQFHSLGFK